MGFNGDLYPTAGASVVMTTSGDMVKYQSGARARLGIGSANQILQVKSSLPSWETVDLADTVLTTAGDVLIENSVPELARVSAGTQYHNFQMGASLPAWSASSTSIMSASGDILYASSANTLAKLAKATDGDTLQLASGIPSWVTVASASTLTKVTKSYTDISANELAIYTLPADQALVNVFTDITTTFDLSTAVTIGDAGDDNGFQQSANWTSATGLTDVTRGVYVSGSKGMRSTSGTTAIKAYGLAGATTWTASTTGSSDRGMGYFGGQAHVGGIIIEAGNDVIGNIINYVDFNFNTLGQGSSFSTDFVVKIFNAANVEKASVSVTYTINEASTNVRFTFAGNTYVCVADDYIQIDNNGSNYITIEAGSATSDDYVGYRDPDPDTFYPHCAVNYGGGDTQGAVDFYLQIVST